MIGRIVSHYKIIEKLGEGGMGIVYKAEDTKLKRTVGLKFLPPAFSTDPSVKERFIHEAQAASALQHSNICTIHEINETDDGQMYIVMDYYEGETLKFKIEEGQLKIDECLYIALQISQGLKKAHEQGIIHRDIKPANIIITNEGDVKILDFGLAKFRGQTKITKTGSTLGTVAYMSPEQAKGEEVDALSDIWSLGVVLYEMLIGELPFKGDYDQAIVYSIINYEPQSIKEKSNVSPELDQIINRILQKDPHSRYSSADELLQDLVEYQKGAVRLVSEIPIFKLLMRTILKLRFAIPTVISILLIIIFTLWFFNRRAGIRWVDEHAIAEIEQLFNEDNYSAAFHLIQRAEKYKPKDPQIKKWASVISTKLTILTDPPGADVYIREYADIEGEWESIGRTPIDSINLPNVSFYLIEIKKTGYENVLAVAVTTSDTLFRKLFPLETIPPDMVYVEGYGDELAAGFLQEKNGFFIDRYEVTNREFKEFINDGGYRNPEYWKNEFIKDGKILTWEEALAEFTDKSGRPGPATWEASDYHDGQDDYPVSGVSWYEAVAYAEYAGKSLPTGNHWDSAAGFFIAYIYRHFGYKIKPISNFNGIGPEPVGKFRGVNSFGAYDMAGNVREWCWNKTAEGRIISGGAWNDANYLYEKWSQLPPFDRSPENGFRCVKYIDREKIPESAFQLIELGGGPDYTKAQPIPENIFKIFKNQFLYDKTDLGSIIEERDDSPADWIIEKVTFNAAYGNERVVAYLYLPKNAIPPFQTLIFYPGIYARHTSEDLLNSTSTEWVVRMFFDYILKNGRAVLYPVYKGTFERNDGQETIGSQTHLYTDWLIKWTKDFRRSIDYLETRSDIDTSKIGFYGHSWGARLGGIIPAVEERLKVNILIVGGFGARHYPEADEINYVPRIKIPTLMLNGEYDAAFSLDTEVKPFFNLLGTPEKDKRLCLYETGHFVPRIELIKETLKWLDKYFGPQTSELF